MDRIEKQILTACVEAEQRRHELLPLLASALTKPEDEVFYSWALRQCPQRGQIPDNPWQFFFHGVECDLRNTADGRILRFDFGPAGRVDTMTAWGVLQFIITSTVPWREYPALRQLFANLDAVNAPHSGDLNKFADYWDRLDRQGCFEHTDPQLLQFLAGHTTVGDDGISRVSYPPGTPDRTIADCAVARRKRLSALGRNLVEGEVLQKEF